jgi:hypothetical protein
MKAWTRNHHRKDPIMAPPDTFLLAPQANSKFIGKKMQSAVESKPITTSLVVFSFNSCPAYPLPLAKHRVGALPLHSTAGVGILPHTYSIVNTMGSLSPTIANFLCKITKLVPSSAPSAEILASPLVKGFQFSRYSLSENRMFA